MFFIMQCYGRLINASACKNDFFTANVIVQAGDQNFIQTDRPAVWQYCLKLCRSISLISVRWTYAVTEMATVFCKKIIEFMPHLNHTGKMAGLFIYIEKLRRRN